MLKIKIICTQLRQQLINGLYDIGFKGGEMLSEVLLTESSWSQQLVEGLLLVCLFTATPRSTENICKVEVSKFRFPVNISLVTGD